jgi:hypothetical protein
MLSHGGHSGLVRDVRTLVVRDIETLIDDFAGNRKISQLSGSAMIPIQPWKTITIPDASNTGFNGIGGSLVPFNPMTAPCGWRRQCLDNPKFHRIVWRSTVDLTMSLKQILGHLERIARLKFPAATPQFDVEILRAFLKPAMRLIVR